MNKKPRILLTCGDPNGIGIEIILKILNTGLTADYDIRLIGPKHVFKLHSDILGFNFNDDILIDVFGKKIKTAKFPENNFRCFDDYDAGLISGRAVETAVKLCLENEFDAMVTMPISKECLNKSGFKFDGHTGMLKKLSKSNSAFMFMFHNKKVYSPLTHHIPLYKVPEFVRSKNLVSEIRKLILSYLKDFNSGNPKIALLSLNPHSGDGGVIGNEEIKFINPALSILKNEFDITGSFPADGFFSSKQFRNIDLIIGFYHDQIMIPFKILSKSKGVNYTSGLPIIRTSPAHGTGFNIAFKGLADISSSVEAIKLASNLVKNKGRNLNV